MNMQKIIKKPSYSKDKELTLKFNILRKEVFEEVERLKPQRERLIRIKAIVFPLAYIFSFLGLITLGENPYIFYGCYIAIGLLLIVNFASLIHDSVHHAFTSNKTINKLYMLLFDLMGANSYIWQIRHNRLHHPFPNVMGWDSDFEQSPIVRVFPQAPFKNFQRYQHLYLPFIYPLYLFNWLLVRDFKDFYSDKAIVRKIIGYNIPKIEYFKLFFFKALFIFNMLILPKLTLGISWSQTFTGFLVMMFTASITSLIILLSPHASLNSEFPEADENGEFHHAWFVHQLLVTNDVSWDNWFTRFFLGSFNYHIAHHIFPNISSAYLPEVTARIEQFAKENNLPYRKFGLFESLKGHWLLLKHNAFHENIFEETM